MGLEGRGWSDVGEEIEIAPRWVVLKMKLTSWSRIQKPSSTRYMINKSSVLIVRNDVLGGRLAFHFPHPAHQNCYDWFSNFLEWSVNFFKLTRIILLDKRFRTLFGYVQLKQELSKVWLIKNLNCYPMHRHMMVQKVLNEVKILEGSGWLRADRALR